MDSALGTAFAADWPVMGAAALKAVAMLLTAVLLFRVTVRRAVAQQAPVDLAVVIAIGAVVGRTATSAQTSYLTGAAVLLTLFALHALLTRLRFLPAGERVMDPQARVLVRDGVVDEKTIRRSGLTRADFEGLLRANGVEDVSTVRLAMFESKGSVTIQTR